MRQEAPDPTILAVLVKYLRYRPGWTVRLEDLDRGQGSVGLTLVITTLGFDSYHPERGETYRVNHYMPVPPAAFDRRSWQRWLLEQFLLVERHEACEFFRFEVPSEFTQETSCATQVERPYAPHHGPGNDPYIVFELGTGTDVRTSFRGDVKAGE